MRNAITKSLRGFAASEDGALRFNTTQAVEVAGPSAEPDGRSYAVNSGLATFGNTGWAIANEPSITGDTFTLALKNLPFQAGYTFIHAQIEVDGQIRDVDFGGKTSMSLPDRSMQLFLRRHYGVASTPSTVRIRAVYVANSNGVTKVAGAWSTSKTVTPTVGAPSIVVHTSRTSSFAPFAMQFLVEPKGFGVLRPWKDLRIRAAIDGGVEDHSRLPSWQPWGRASDVVYGYIGGFCMTTPGTHTVTVAVTDGSASQNASPMTTTVALTATDPNTVFASTNYTIGSDGAYTTMAACLAAIGAPTNLRMSLKRGESHTWATISKGQNVFVDAYGTGADPLVNLGGSACRFSSNVDDGDVVFAGLEFLGRVDNQDINSSLDRSLAAISSVGGARPATFTLHNSKISKCAFVADVPNARAWYFVNIEYTDMTNYFCLHSDGEGPTVALGLYIHQDPNIIRADGKNENAAPYAADHFGIRISRPFNPCCFIQMNGYCNFSWTNAGNQAMIRWAQSGISSGQMMNTSQIVSETHLGGTGGDNQNTPMTVMARIDKVIGMPSVNGTLSINSGGSYITNAIWTNPNRETQNGRPPETLVGGQLDQPTLQPVLRYKTTSVRFTKGATVLGGTSGAYGTILGDSYNNGTVDGILTLASITGTFVDGETVTGTSGGSAIADGPSKLSGAPKMVRFSAGSGTLVGVSVLDSVTGNTSLRGGSLRGHPYIESGTLAGNDAVGTVNIDDPRGFLTNGEVVSTSGSLFSFTVTSSAAFDEALDPYNPAQEGQVVSSTLAHLYDDTGATGNADSVKTVRVFKDSGATVQKSIYNSIVYIPNLSAEYGGTGSQYEPLDATTNWTPHHTGRRFYRDKSISYTSGNGKIPASTVVLGGTSGAQAKVLMVQNVTSGSFGAGTAAGTVLLEYAGWDPAYLPAKVLYAGASTPFQNGETVTGGGFSFVIASVAENALFTRDTGLATSTAYWTPQTGSLAIGNANKADPCALDDFWGALRGTDPSLGATEPD